MITSSTSLLSTDSQANNMPSQQQYYDKVSDNEGDIDLDQPADKPSALKRFSWGQQSFIIRTLVIAIYTILIAGICSAIVEYRHSDDASSTPTAAVATSAAAVTKAFSPPEATGQAENSKVVIEAMTSGDKPSDGLSEITHCGSNYKEARELGCVYDVMMQLWMPPACYDGVLSERFLAEGNWTWWKDADNGITMTDEEMRKGEHTVAYMLQDYHKMHCIFAMEKLVRSLRNSWPLIPELISLDHMVHCKHKTLHRTDGEVRGVRAPTGFTSCGYYDTWKQQLPEDHESSTS